MSRDEERLWMENMYGGRPMMYPYADNRYPAAPTDNDFYYRKSQSFYRDPAYMNLVREREEKIVMAEKKRMECRMKSEKERQVIFNNNKRRSNSMGLRDNERILTVKDGDDNAVLANAFFYHPATFAHYQNRDLANERRRQERREMQKRKTIESMSKLSLESDENED